MEFKKLEIEQENKGIKTVLQSAHFRRSLIFIILGALGGFGWYYFTEARHMEVFMFSQAIGSILIGAFLGFFITNSPCARNRC